MGLDGATEVGNSCQILFNEMPPIFREAVKAGTKHLREIDKRRMLV